MKLRYLAILCILLFAFSGCSADDTSNTDAQPETNLESETILDTKTESESETESATEEESELETESETETETSHSHDYTYSVESDSTCANEGIGRYTCACGHSYTEAIETKSHSYGEYKYNDDATTSADGTETAICSGCGGTSTRTATGTKLSEYVNGIHIGLLDQYYLGRFEVHSEVIGGKVVKDYIVKAVQVKYELESGRVKDTHAVEWSDEMILTTSGNNELAFYDGQDMYEGRLCTMENPAYISNVGDFTIGGMFHSGRLNAIRIRLIAPFYYDSETGTITRNSTEFVPRDLYIFTILQGLDASYGSQISASTRADLEKLAGYMYDTYIYWHQYLRGTERENILVNLETEGYFNIMYDGPDFFEYNLTLQ